MKQIRRGAFLSYVNILIKNAMNIIYTPLLIQFAGKMDFGIYQLTSQMVTTLSLLSMGFSGAYIHFFWIEAKKGNKFVSKLNGTYIKIFSLMAIVSLFLSVVIIFFIPNIFGKTFSGAEINLIRPMVLILSLNISITFLSSVFDSYIAANQRFVFQQTRIALTTLIQPIIVIPLLITGGSVIVVAMVQFLISVMLLFLNMRFAFSRLGMKFDFSGDMSNSSKIIFKFSGFLLLNDVVDIINNNLPGTIVGMILGPASVAVYAIVVQIRSIFFQLSVSLSNVFIPTINQMFVDQADNKSFTDVMIKVGRIQLTILSFVFGGFIILGEFFIYKWAGRGFEQAYWMLIITLFPTLIPLSQNVGIEIQRAKNLHKFRSIILGFIAMLNIVITYLSIKMWGLNGAVFGYIFSLVVGNGLIINIYNHFVVGLDMIRYWKKMARVIFGSSFSIFIGFLLRKSFGIHNLSDFFILGLVYVMIFSLIWYFFVADNIEKNIIHSTLQRVKY